MATSAATREVTRSRCGGWLICGFLGVALAAGAARAQAPSDDAPGGSPAPAPSLPAAAPPGDQGTSVVPPPSGIAASSPSAPRVIAVDSHHPKHPRRAGLHDRISIAVANPQALLVEVADDCSRLVLFLDGIPLAGMPPESCHPDTGVLRYELDRSEDNDKAWHSLLGHPDGFSRKVTVSVGPSGGFPVPTDVRDFELVIASPPVVYIFFAILAAVILVFLRITRRTAMLRDLGADGKPGAYNLARVQLAFWFFVVLSSFIFIWLITEELDTITGSVLALLGIGSGTALGAAMVEGNGRTRTESEAPAPSEGFVRDMVSDDRGISLYHFQLSVWTLVLGIIFLVEVYGTLSMPELNGTLLGLLGISSGTFLGSKVPTGNR